MAWFSTAMGLLSVLIWSNIRQFYPPPERLQAWIPRFIIPASVVSLGFLAYGTWNTVP